MKEIDRAIYVMADIFGYRDPKQLFHKCRKQELVTARYLLCLYFRDTLKLSYHQIADIVNLDHSTVVVGVQRIRERLNNNNIQYFYEKLIWADFNCRITSFIEDQMNEIRERNIRTNLDRLRALVQECMSGGKARRASNYIDKIILELKIDKRQWREKETPSR